jgi:hypothetical protein
MKKYIFTESQIKKVVDAVIAEDMNASKMSCTFTITELMGKNKQGLNTKKSIKPKQFEVVDIKGQTSLEVGNIVSISQRIKMGKGEIVFKDITGYGQAIITCDGTVADFNVSTN